VGSAALLAELSGEDGVSMSIQPRMRETRVGRLGGGSRAAGGCCPADGAAAGFAASDLAV